MAVKPGQGTDQEDNFYGSLLFSEDLRQVCDPCGFVDRHVHSVVADAREATQLVVDSVAVTHLPPGEAFCEAVAE